MHSASPEQSRRILVVDDELSIRESFSLILEGKYKIFLTASGEAALKTIADQKIDMVYLDIRMPGMDGLETLKRMKELDPDLEIIMITALNEVQKASQAIKLGARDYVVKPFDVDNILRLTEQILRKKGILSEGSKVQGKSALELIGQSDKIEEILKSIDKLKGNERVLIAGEIGTEKEVVARLIHEKSGRRDLPFISIHLSSTMSPHEIKSIFLRQSKGSSTADLSLKSGISERSQKGTLFINNVEHLPEEILSSIESHLIGGTSADPAAKNKELFNFFIQIPPLRKRSSDIPLLINFIIDKNNALYGKEVKITSSAFEVLTNYDWPGNTQELEVLIERLVLSSDDEISLEDLPLDILLKTRENLGGELLSAFEKEYIQSVYKHCGKDKDKTAAFLGINLTVLETKI